MSDTLGTDTTVGVAPRANPSLKGYIVIPPTPRAGDPRRTSRYPKDERTEGDK